MILISVAKEESQLQNYVSLPHLRELIEFIVDLSKTLQLLPFEP
jgi:hypothetical protein